MAKQKLSDKLFNQLSANLARVNDQFGWGIKSLSPNRLQCPQCLRVKDKSEFSEEHVPPKALGGKLVTLTCTVCNNASGRSVDSHLVNVFNNPFHFEATSTRATVIDDNGNRFAGNLKSDRRDLIFEVVRRATRNANVRSLWEERKPSNIQVTDHSPMNFRLATAGHLRIAYLLIFSVFGYAFLNDNNLERIRQFINENQSDDLLHWGIVADYPYPDKMLGVNLIDAPSELWSFLVVYDLRNRDGNTYRCGTIIPAPYSGNVYEILSQRQHTGLEYNLGLWSFGTDWQPDYYPFE